MRKPIKKGSPTMRIFITVVLLTSNLAVSAQETQTRKARNSAVVSPEINKRFLDPDLNIDDWVKRFEIESREVYAQRKKIVTALNLKPGHSIADVGAGTGLFLQPFSKAVGPRGKVFAVDISPGMIKHIQTRVKDENVANAVVIHSTNKSIKLKPASVDRVFICDTYHHFEHYPAMLKSIRSALKPSGQLVIIDFEKIPGKTRAFLMRHVRADKETFRTEVQSAGFKFLDEVKIDGFKENYFLRFEKPKTNSAT